MINLTRILLADDNADLRSALGLLLETRLGVRVVGEAGDMAELLAEVADLHPEAVVLDWELPGEPAAGRLEALRGLSPEMRVIVTSARPEAAAQAEAAKADAFINKSDPPETILRVFQET